LLFSSWSSRCCFLAWTPVMDAPPATYTLAAKSQTGRTPSCDPTGCCCPICGAVTWLVWSLLIYIVGTILGGFAGANIILAVYAVAVFFSTGLTKTPNFSVTDISYTSSGKLPEPQYTVAYCCFGIKEQSDGTVEEVDPEAPAPAPAAGAKKPTVPIPKKAYLTAMKKSHGLL